MPKSSSPDRVQVGRKTFHLADFSISPLSVPVTFSCAEINCAARDAFLLVANNVESGRENPITFSLADFKASKGTPDINDAYFLGLLTNKHHKCLTRTGDNFTARPRLFDRLLAR